MAVKYTSSAASGYMTDVMWDVAFGPFRCFLGHYSAPSNATGYVDVGMSTIKFCNVEDADPSTYQFATNSAGGQTVYFSGMVAGCTGRMFILGN